MKKLYTSIILAVVLALSSTAASAQSLDLSITRFIANVSNGEPLHVMTDADTIIVNPTTPVQYAFAYLIINAGPDHIVASDTLIFSEFYIGGLVGYYGITSDTFQVGPDTISFSPTVTTQTFTLCDTVFAEDLNGVFLSDPNPANNLFCSSNYVDLYNVGTPVISKNTTGLNIYPNPATSNVNFKYDFTNVKKATLTIQDIVGRTVYTEELTNLNGTKNVTVNVNNFVPGMYMTTLVTDDVRTVGKFNVQK